MVERHRPRLNLLHGRTHQDCPATFEDGRDQWPGQGQRAALGKPGAVHVVRHNHGVHREGSRPGASGCLWGEHGTHSGSLRGSEINLSILIMYGRLFAKGDQLYTYPCCCKARDNCEHHRGDSYQPLKSHAINFVLSGTLTTQLRFRMESHTNQFQ